MSLVSTILVVGATGNTGSNAVQTLSQLFESKKAFANSRIVGLTRNASSDKSKSLAALPHVEMMEKDWVLIEPEWLQQQNVTRVYIASHNGPDQFSDESTFHRNLLVARVKYVVRISTTAANVTADSAVYYARTHWAIENMLSQPEYRDLQWTSLQPNIFLSMVLDSGADFIKHYRKTGEKQRFTTVLPADVPVAPIDGNDVGAIAAYLLAEEDPTPHNKKRYVLNGPVDITGNQIVEMIEKRAGTKVEDKSFQDMSFVDAMVKAGAMSQKVGQWLAVISTISWEGKANNSPKGGTSPEILKLRAPKGTPESELSSLLQE